MFSISQVKKILKIGHSIECLSLSCENRKIVKNATKMRKEVELCCPIRFLCVVKQNFQQYNCHKSIVKTLHLTPEFRIPLNVFQKYSKAKPYSTIVEIAFSIIYNLLYLSNNIIKTNFLNRIHVHCAAMYIFAFLSQKSSIIHFACQ